MKNTGLNLQKEREDSSAEDRIFGAFTQINPIVTIPEHLRNTYLPEGEVQKGREDFMDCATRAPLNKLEADFSYFYNTTMQPENKKWLEDNGYVNSNKITFSDRWIAIKSGTTKEGNSLIAPLQAINDWGLIPKKLLPANASMTWNDYMNIKDIITEIENLAKEFKRHFKVNYDKVFAIHTAEVLKEDMLVTAGYAWPEPENGEYPRAENDFNHIFLKIWLPLTYIFDNYIDFDNDFFKKLASNYKFLSYDYRVFISAEYTALTQEKINQISNLISKINSILQNIINILKNKATGYFGDIFR